jgi:hypothetical protein
VYQVVKRDGRIVDFDISKIAAAIQKAYEAVHTIDEEIDALDYRDLSPEEYEEIKRNLKEWRREAEHHCKSLIQSLNDILRTSWLKRNRCAGRSNTSAVSDKMLLTIPTPPTAEAAIRSLWQRGMADGAVA